MVLDERAAMNAAASEQWLFAGHLRNPAGINAEGATKRTHGQAYDVLEIRFDNCVVVQVGRRFGVANNCRGV